MPDIIRLFNITHQRNIAPGHIRLRWTGDTTPEKQSRS